MTVLAILTAIMASLVAASPVPSEHMVFREPMAITKNGTIAGFHQPTYHQDCFLGVPYAQPPVGDLRFRNPQSLSSKLNETYHAKKYKPSCIGYGLDDTEHSISEDCLYLNIVRPSGYEGQQLPVGFWIHGGGFQSGGTQEKVYNLSFIVHNSVTIGKPIIGVSVDYRLSGWGFLSSNEVVGSGNTNIGLRDQRLALHWVQENIAAFGGDPTKVTIWGESVGAFSVGSHLTAYNGRDDKLFWAAIMESGSPIFFNSYRDAQTYQPQYDNLVNRVGCAKATDNLQCLRHASVESINSVFNTSGLTSSWLPIIDGDFIQRYASIQLAQSNFVRVPIISGANSDEGTLFGMTGINSDEEFVQKITSNRTQVFVGKQFGDQVLAAYPDTCEYFVPNGDELPCNVQYPKPYGSQYRRSNAYFGDAVMIANRRGTVQAWASHGVPAYSYRFNTIPNGFPWTIGATHFTEIPFVFGNTIGVGYGTQYGNANPFAHKSKMYYDLAGLMSCSWASFIHDRNPNFKGRRKGTPDWPTYDVDEPQNIVWDANCTSLAYNEPDMFRKEGIQWILNHALDYHR